MASVFERCRCITNYFDKIQYLLSSKWLRKNWIPIFISKIVSIWFTSFERNTFSFSLKCLKCLFMWDNARAYSLHGECVSTTSICKEHGNFPCRKYTRNFMYSAVLWRCTVEIYTYTLQFGSWCDMMRNPRKSINKSLTLAANAKIWKVIIFIK